MKEDQYIWEEFKNEKDHALSYIYHQNIDFLFSYGKKFTKDKDLLMDVIQDLFYSLIKSRKNLGETNNIRLYLLKSFRRMLVREMERSKRLTDLQVHYQPDPEIAFSVEEELISNEAKSKALRIVQQGMKELNPKQREVLFYKYTCDFSYPEICEIMSVTPDYARQLVSRAIHSMKKYLSSNDFVFFFIFKNFLKK
ncbi:MAG: RNA polymerase sigma factor [Mangrovibacterium sp.]